MEELVEIRSGVETGSYPWAEARLLGEALLAILESRDQRIKKLMSDRTDAVLLAKQFADERDSRDQRIKELTVALQDLYDWGPGENATLAAKQSWDDAYEVLLNARG
jgi:hypothetical protein